MNVEDEVLSKIKPSPQEYVKINDAIRKVVQRLEGFNPEVHGSFAKDTWLSGASDVDVFVFFPSTTSLEWIRSQALSLIKAKLSDLPWQIEYADHPYLKVLVDGIWIDVVPAVAVEEGSKPVTPVDRTRFHTVFVRGNFTPEMKDQVRLLKAFMKGIGVYGAEQRVKGFSGYLAELLIYHLRDFKGVLSAASSWGPKVVLGEPIRNFPEPLVVPDPIDPHRNVAAAVSIKRLAEFSLAARYYLTSPSLRFFYPPTVSDVPAVGDVLVVEVKPREYVAEEVLWGQVNSVLTKVRRSLGEAGFRVIDVGACEGLKLLVQVESKEIGRFKLHQGPPFYMRDDVSSFIASNDQVWIGEDGRLLSIKRRTGVMEDVVKGCLTFKFDFDLSFKWVSKGDDPCVAAFLRKTPTWLH
ncbi:CCA tRNA nucleotidyltransferase [Sulfodiicoccus acidiphilus]|uniref:CCA tRNA nucleotidyltransferase n=1 Tax=Sulfodiicoccus acidiphilus TaxID=1670455 RepID=UPI000F81C660|nr:CCA tRNA nucleotidyltransferase [Sulfodiicoccus acidiphilus]